MSYLLICISIISDLQHVDVDAVQTEVGEFMEIFETPENTDDVELIEDTKVDIIKKPGDSNQHDYENADHIEQFTSSVTEDAQPSSSCAAPVTFTRYGRS